MVKRTTPKGDPHAVLDAIDKFIRTEQVMLMNIGDAKGKIVQDIIAQRKPQVKHTSELLPVDALHRSLA